jgi:Zn-dependent peptidase ImmA (M78 family)/DNA-binding XRE family transcriptional regulator
MRCTLEPFSPNRLTVARERRGLTKKALSEVVGLSAQAITAFEDGSTLPLSDTVTRLAFSLRFPLGWFYSSSLEDLPPDAISFRSRSRMTTSTRAMTLATGQIACDFLSPALQRYFSFPALDLPDLNGDTPERAAKILRDYWKLGQGPIKNMVHLLEAKGIEVYWINLESDCVDAVSFWRDNKPYVLLNLTKPAGERERFDLAHELAHLVLHRQAKIGPERNLETQAHNFASAFLLPETQFRAECPRQPLLTLFLPLVRRATDLGIFTHWQYETASKAINANGWRKKEPLELPRQHSALHTMAFARLQKKGILPCDLAKNIQIGLEDLYEIAPVSQMYAGSLVEQPVISDSERTLGHLRLVS